MTVRVCVCAHVCLDPLKSPSNLPHMSGERLRMIIEDDLNLSPPPFARPLILIKGENISVSL